MPHASPNAITVSSAIIGDLAELGAIPVATPPDVAQHLAVAAPVLDDVLGAGAAETLTHVSVSIGTIVGGLKVNLIAPSCRTAIDLRCPVGVSTEEVLRAFERIVQRYRATSDVTYTVINRTEPNYCAPDHPMVGIIQANAEQARGIRPVPSISLGGTDARLWRLAGILAYVYGPTPTNMGAPNEYVTLDDLFGTVRVHVLSAYDYLIS
jgi:succinyl-diaminopimelate desuccinylase